MANFIYNEAKRALGAGEINWASADIRVCLVMTNTTADTEDDVNTFGAAGVNFTTFDEFDGAGYSAGGVALASEALAEDSANNRAELDAGDAAFGALSSGTRAIQGAIVYMYTGGSFANSMPLAWIDTGGFPVTPAGASVTIQWNAEGIIQIA